MFLSTRNITSHVPNETDSYPCADSKQIAICFVTLLPQETNMCSYKLHYCHKKPTSAATSSIVIFNFNHPHLSFVLTTSTLSLTSLWLNLQPCNSNLLNWTDFEASKYQHLVSFQTWSTPPRVEHFSATFCSYPNPGTTDQNLNSLWTHIPVSTSKASPRPEITECHQMPFFTPF